MPKVPAEIERIVSVPKFKQRKVSTVQDFLPGYRRVTVPRSSRQITVNQSGFDAQDFLVLLVIRAAKCQKAKNMAYVATRACEL
ncbi:hypothetical protein J1N35_011745 [Gossypium stocksii]|uniref:Uncharacterized protein n=1 Tax=Gossypium stocksii TaxID=47602 RepID=A0A9D3W3B3_9ROSI|nr:hypothetical protein J1N35_011745 [Gossypium stocksii]